MCEVQRLLGRSSIAMTQLSAIWSQASCMELLRRLSRYLRAKRLRQFANSMAKNSAKIFGLRSSWFGPKREKEMESLE